MTLRTIGNNRLVDGEKLDNLPADTQGELDLKVDKITGKGLSANDYTTIEKNKLALIAPGAEVNEVSEAPKDGKQYARKDGGWNELTSGLGDMEKTTYDPTNVKGDVFDSSNTNYNNTDSGLTATKVKPAIDELNSGVDANTQAIANLSGSQGAFGNTSAPIFELTIAEQVIPFTVTVPSTNSTIFEFGTNETTFKEDVSYNFSTNMTFLFNTSLQREVTIRGRNSADDTLIYERSLMLEENIGDFDTVNTALLLTPGVGTVPSTPFTMYFTISIDDETPSIELYSFSSILSSGVVHELSAEQIFEKTGEIDLEPTGFENRTDSQLGLIDISRTLYVEPTVTDFTVWVKGKKYTFDSRQSTIIPDVSGTYMTYIDEDGNIQNMLISSITETIFLSSAFICYAYWNSTLQTFLRTTPGEERHGMVMDGATHYRLHLDDGTKIRRTEGGTKLGHQLTDIIADGDGDLDSAITFGKDSGKISDEDLVITIPVKLTTGNIPLYYKISGVWFVEENQYALKNATLGRLQYNDLTTIGSETISEVSNLDYMLIHHGATNGGSGEPIAFMGQAVYTTRGNARDGAETELNNLVISGLPGPEIVFTHSVIYQTSNTYDNTHKARIISTDSGDDFIDWRSSALNGTGGVSLPSSTASDISVDITNFDNNLSNTDTDVQKALETIDDLDFVSKSGDETISDIKTFSSSPIVPTPTTGTQAANKDYVDANAGGDGSALVIPGLIPAESKGLVSSKSPIFLYRKGISPECDDKIYSDVTGDLLGIYSGITNGYENSLTDVSGIYQYIYGDNVYGGLISHSQSIINSIELYGTFLGSGTYDFGIYPLIATEIDQDNPLVEVNNIDFDSVIKTTDEQISEISLTINTPTPTTMLSFLAKEDGDMIITYDNKIASDSAGYEAMTIYVDGVSKGGTAPTTTYVSQKVRIIGVTAGQTIDFKVSEGTSTSVTFYLQNVVQISNSGLEYFNIDFGNTTITPGTDYGFLLVNSDGDYWNSVSLNGSNTVGTNLFHSTTGITGSMTPQTGGVYNHLYSPNVITPIDLITQGIYTHFEALLDNTTYYITPTGELSTTATSNIELGKTVSTTKVLLTF